MPSLTREERTSRDLWPLLRQWNRPLGQADVPGSSEPSLEGKISHNYNTRKRIHVGTCTMES